MQVDVFSFGIVMWEILTGEEPYATMHYGAIIGKAFLFINFIIFSVMSMQDQPSTISSQS